MLTSRLNSTTDWFTPTVRHSGTHFIWRTTGGNAVKLDNSKLFRRGQISTHFWPHYMPLIHKISEMLPTVIPLRHPALIATSFKKRKQGGYVKEWMRMCEIEGFHFPLETKPYDELEEYLGRPVVRDDTVVNSIGEYPEKDSIQSAKAYLGIDWVNVEAMLATPIGQRFYSNSLP